MGDVPVGSEITFEVRRIRRSWRCSCGDSMAFNEDFMFLFKWEFHGISRDFMMIQRGI